MNTAPLQKLQQLTHHPLFIPALLTSILLISSTIFLFTIFADTDFKLITQTNQTPVSTTITWYTKKPTKGCLWLLHLGFPKRRCDDHGQKRTNHYITLNHLTPQTTYTLLLRSGIHTQLYTVKTPQVPENLPQLPNPAYGQLVSDNQQTIDHATVMIVTKSGIYATLTDDQGYWSLDLTNRYPQNTRIPLIIAWNNYVISSQSIITGHHQPTANITIEQAALEATNNTNQFGDLPQQP